jgi:hypothetical protein
MDAISLYVKIKPNASESRIGELSESLDGRIVLKIYIRAIPQKGEANKELINFLSSTWKIPKSQITIVKGVTNSNKLLSVKNPPIELVKFLQSAK